MSKITQKQLETLVAKAVRNRTFRDKLIVDAQKVALTLKIVLDTDDVKELKKITADLQRFGGNPELDSRDAKGWTVGICQIRTLVVNPK